MRNVPRQDWTAPRLAKFLSSEWLCMMVVVMMMMMMRRRRVEKAYGGCEGGNGRSAGLR
jgi:hypothetical protein